MAKPLRAQPLDDAVGVPALADDIARLREGQLDAIADDAARLIDDRLVAEVQGAQDVPTLGRAARVEEVWRWRRERRRIDRLASDSATGERQAGNGHAQEREDAQAIARQLSWGTIHRLWQMLLKALQDVAIAPDPREAAEMALLRLIHAADMPDPAALVAKLSGEGTTLASASAPAAKPSGPSARLPDDFPSLIKALEHAGRHQLAVQLHYLVGLVRFAPQRLAGSGDRGASSRAASNHSVG